MKALALSCVALLCCAGAAGEQMRRFGDWQVHYMLVQTTFLKAEIAAGYGITRGRDRAMLNISVLDADQKPTRVTIHGHVTNLLEQQQPLDFAEVSEGSAVYYLATVKHTDQEVLRFEVTITPPGESPKVLKFQQRVYWDRG